MYLQFLGTHLLCPILWPKLQVSLLVRPGEAPWQNLFQGFKCEHVKLQNTATTPKLTGLVSDTDLDVRRGGLLPGSNQSHSL